MNNIQCQLLNLSIENKLFRSLISNKIKEIRADMNVNETVEDRYCRLIMTFSNNLSDSEMSVTDDRKYDRLEWVFSRVQQCISSEPYYDFWPKREMARCLLNENCKTVFTESIEFMTLVFLTFIFLFDILIL